MPSSSPARKTPPISSHPDSQQASQRSDPGKKGGSFLSFSFLLSFRRTLSDGRGMIHRPPFYEPFLSSFPPPPPPPLPPPPRRNIRRLPPFQTASRGAKRRSDVKKKRGPAQSTNFRCYGRRRRRRHLHRVVGAVFSALLPPSRLKFDPATEKRRWGSH